MDVESGEEGDGDDDIENILQELYVTILCYNLDFS